MNYKTDTPGNTGTLILDGEVNIQCTGELRDVLLKSQEFEDTLLLNLEGVTGTDLSFLQLLCSAHRSSVKLNKRVAVTGNVPITFRQVAIDAGYEKEVCRSNSGGSCLWSIIRGEE